MSSHELDSLLLENWTDLDAVAGRFESIQEIVFAAFSKAVEAWARGREWSGVFDAPDALWMSPPEWTTKPAPRPDAYAWFQLDYVDADENFWALTSLAGIGHGGMLFRVRQTRLRKRDWDAAVVAAHLPAFKLDDIPSLTRPITIDSELLAPALRTGNFTALFRPLSEALDNMEAAVPVISGLLGARPEAA